MTSDANDRSAQAALERIVKAYDVRGEAGTELTVDIARALGAAFADSLESPEMIVAHDMRVSSPELAEAFADGAVRRGSTVAFAGLSSTDQLYCASGLHRAAGAMVTASHNPPGDNGFKLCLPGAEPISRDTGLAAIRDRAAQLLEAGTIEEVPGGRREELETLADYADTVLSLVPVADRRPLRVVVDAANAMAGLTFPAVAERLPQLHVVPMHFELDGTFPNHAADPLDSSTLAELRERVVAESADLGLAFDGDADRCVVVDEHGAVVPPSAVTALIAVREIARARAAGEESPAVVANLVSSRHVDEAIAAAGGRRVRAKVGHSLIKALMAEQGAVFGGEHSAHYYFRDFFFADSGMLAALHVLAALEETDRPLSALIAEHDPYAASGEINSRVDDAAAAREAVRAAMSAVDGARIDDLDGMTVTHWDDAGPAPENWWFSLRSSNTEPLLRLNVEAADPGTMERVRDEVLAIVRGWTADAEAAGAEAVGAEAATTSAAEHARRAAAQGVAASGADVPAWVRDALRCPVCGGVLDDGDASLVCTGCGRAYPVRGGIPVIIAQDLPQSDEEPDA